VERRIGMNNDYENRSEVYFTWSHVKTVEMLGYEHLF